jgi:hypothetical protein
MLKARAQLISMSDARLLAHPQHYHSEPAHTLLEEGGGCYM